MKFASHVFLIAVIVWITGCVSNGPSILSKGTDDEIRAEAVRTAKADITSGHPRICIAGSIGKNPIGIPPESLDSIKNLPRWSLPSGCTEPLASKSVIFAGAYNAEVLEFLGHNGH